MLKTDILIIGGGLAAVVTALKLASHYQVTIALKGTIKNGNSWRAQGGIAAALSSSDTPFLHYKDTMRAGCYQNDKKLVEILVKEGPSRLREWINKGLCFDTTSEGKLALGQEGAHSKRRIIHNQGDQTGKVCMSFFWERLKQENVRILENYHAVDLLINEESCLGAIFKNKFDEPEHITAAATVLATGGIGGLYDVSTNDPSLVGDGIAMAYRAGAVLRDLEFVQFHPTLIYSQSRVIGLASEALRGEGAKLVDGSGQSLMEGVHPLGDLAPRDVVARVIHSYINSGQSIFLDVASIENFEERFPQITDLCHRGNVDLSEKRLPVRPGAHFHMGGVQTDCDGQTTISNLYAVGEVSGNNVHGANRLASNSLLEAIVFGERLAEFLIQRGVIHDKTEAYSNTKEMREERPPLPSISEMKKKVSQALGIMRNKEDLMSFINWLEKYTYDDEEVYRRVMWSKEEVERDNMRVVAMLMAKAALHRKASCGAHERSDWKASSIRLVQRESILHSKGSMWIEKVEKMRSVLK